MMVMIIVPPDLNVISAFGIEGGNDGEGEVDLGMRDGGEWSRETGRGRKRYCIYMLMLDFFTIPLVFFSFFFSHESISMIYLFFVFFFLPTICTFVIVR
ncbi:hypothetical protein Sjap_014249 [Stephania japonica]|uniref:Transmembrane protein n=1 Tax=Stephania japonica TaxID=461633 RepID=A0AAP0IZA2_9MAGN